MTVKERLAARSTRLSSGCLIWRGYRNERGYGVINIGGKATKAHRAAWLAHRGQIPDGVFVCHECDNPACIEPNHLFLGTNADNVADMVAKGRHSRGPSHGATVAGARHPAAKLTEADVRELRRLRGAGVPVRELASRFGVSTGSVSRVARGHGWRGLA